MPMLWKGRTQTLELEDLYPVPEHKRCKVLRPPLALAWENTVRNRKPSIWKALFVVAWKEFLSFGIIYFVKECVLR